jgi:hypothetical protein
MMHTIFQGCGTPGDVIEHVHQIWYSMHATYLDL